MKRKYFIEDYVNDKKLYAYCDTKKDALIKAINHLFPDEIYDDDMINELEEALEISISCETDYKDIDNE